MIGGFWTPDHILVFLYDRFPFSTRVCSASSVMSSRWPQFSTSKGNNRFLRFYFKTAWNWDNQRNINQNGRRKPIDLCRSSAKCANKWNRDCFFKKIAEQCLLRKDSRGKLKSSSSIRPRCLFFFYFFLSSLPKCIILQGEAQRSSSIVCREAGIVDRPVSC